MADSSASTSSRPTCSTEHEDDSTDTASSESVVPVHSLSPEREETEESRIVDMVARDLCPAALVEGGGFKDLMKYIEPGYKVPTATHISEAVRKKHVAAKGSLKVKLQDA